MQLSIIIVNYNVKYFLEQCLCAAQKACKGIESEIIVIDNNSSDGSQNYLEEKFPGVFFKWEKQNLGFAKANNVALPDAKGDFVLFLNPDTIVPEDCFEKSLSFLKANPLAGALGVRMIDGSGQFLKESKRSFPTPLASLFKITGLASVFKSSSTFSAYYAGHVPEHHNSEVDVLAGAFMMLSRTCLEKVHGFDEDYFMYGEDIDLSYRIQKAGFKNYYFADTCILHFKGESTLKKSYTYVHAFFDAMEVFISKHYRKKRLMYFLMRGAIVTSRLFAYIKATFKKTGSTRILPGATHVAIIAEQQPFQEMIRLMRHSPVPLIFRGRISPGDPKGIHIGTVQDIPRLIKKYELDRIVFCEGPLSFKFCIEQAYHLQKKTGFLFHASGSKSVVGSSSKNERGITIANKE